MIRAFNVLNTVLSCILFSSCRTRTCIICSRALVAACHVRRAAARLPPDAHWSSAGASRPLAACTTCSRCSSCPHHLPPPPNRPRRQQRAGAGIQQQRHRHREARRRTHRSSRGLQQRRPSPRPQALALARHECSCCTRGCSNASASRIWSAFKVWLEL